MSSIGSPSPSGGSSVTEPSGAVPQLVIVACTFAVVPAVIAAGAMPTVNPSGMSTWTCASM